MKELISDISHQTRTPIANQKIYLEILRQQELPGEAYGFLDKLEHQTDKLDFLFQSLVKMSRLETGVIQIQKKNCDLAETLKKRFPLWWLPLHPSRSGSWRRQRDLFPCPMIPSGRKRRSSTFWTMQSSIQNLAAGSGFP